MDLLAKERALNAEPQQQITLLEVQRHDLELDRVRHRRATLPEAVRVTEIQTAQRTLADGLPAELMALYDKLRADNGGIGAAALQRGRCEGCRIELTPVDLERIRAAAPAEVVRCEECRRILVRTPESGL